MQRKKIAIGGILVGTVMAGLGVVTLLGSLEEAERPDHGPVAGHEDVGDGHSDVEPLPLPSSSAPTGRPTARLSEATLPEAVDEPEGGAYVPDESVTPADEVAQPPAPTKTAAPANPGRPKPTSTPTQTSEPEPTKQSSPTAPTTEPEPTETSTPTTEPQSVGKPG